MESPERAGDSVKLPVFCFVNDVIEMVDTLGLSVS